MLGLTLTALATAAMMDGSVATLVTVMATVLYLLIGTEKS